MLFRAIVAFVALPGMVAYAIPMLLIAPDDAPFNTARGITPLALGTALLLWCVRRVPPAGASI